MITFIDTGSCERKTLGEGQGETAEIVNNDNCGAEQMRAALRWLGEGDRFEVAPLPGSHQVIYIMEGNGVVSLNGKEYDVGPGAGLYLGPGEGADLRGGETLKAFHLIGEPL
jgi:mannose-6-phosphate isomerase-like protein (cupin superfamily)